MNKLIALSSAVVLVLTCASGAQAGGLFSKRTSLLGGVTGIVAGVATKDINVLNGTTVAIGTGPILSGNNVLSGNGILNGSNLLNGVGVLNGNGILGISVGKPRHSRW